LNQDVRQILFLCTGNYYRSRFAELLFNAHATKLNLSWRADSRGLALERGIGNLGSVARCVLERMEDLGHSVRLPLPQPRQVSHDELSAAARVICLKEAEHRPLLSERYAGWQDRVEYWHIHDIDFATVEETLSGIERNIADLVKSLSNGGQE